MEIKDKTPATRKKFIQTRKFKAVILAGAAIAVFSMLSVFCVAIFLGIRAIGVKGSGNLDEKIFNISQDEIKSIELKTDGKVQVQIGDENKVLVKAEDNILKRLNVDNSSGNLKISQNQSFPYIFGANFQNTKDIEIYVVLKNDIESIKISGPGSMQTPVFDSDDFTVDISGSGDLSMAGVDSDKLKINISGSGSIAISNLTSNDLEIKLSGSGNVTIAGRTTDMDVTVNGSGNVDAAELATVESKINVSGSGNVSLEVIRRLDVEISGSGDVVYTGRPEIKQKTTGTGELSNED